MPFLQCGIIYTKPDYSIIGLRHKLNVKAYQYFQSVIALFKLTKLFVNF